MSAKSILVVVVLLGASVSSAQSSTDPSPPPLVPVSPPPMPSPEPGVAPATLQPTPPPLPASTVQPGTPPPPAAAPPSYVPGSPSYVPGTQPSYPGYPYSPYGSPVGREKPGPEVGLMVSEALFGMLTAGASLVLPYVLFSLSGITDFPTVGNIILIALMTVVPMATAQTQVGIANGSSSYQTETWVPLLAGLLGDALVYLTYVAWNGGFSQAPPTLFPANSRDGTGVPPTVAPQIIYLLVAAAVGVPLLQMAAINLFKQPRFRPYAGSREPNKGLALGLPMPVPIFSQTSAGPSVGLGLSLLRGSF